MSSTDKIGAWRDRTNLFISYRQSYTHHPAKRTRLTGPSGNDRYSDGDSERAGLMFNQDTDGDAVIEMDLLPPRWLDIQDEISTLLGEIAGKMKRLEQLHAKHVLPGFDDESVKAKEEREIEGLTQEITRGFTTCQNRIRRIDAMVREQQQQQGGILSQADEKMARNLKMSLAARVGDVSTLFRKKQSAYLKKLRSLGGMHTPIDRAGTPLAQNPYTDPAMMDSETDRSSAQSTLLQTAQVRRRTGVLDSAIEQREREIEKIAQGVIEMSNIFQELNSMVIDQGSLLDRIDYNVERTAEHVKAAEKELTVATGYQKKSTKRKIILLLILIVMGMFVLLLFKPKRSAAAPAPAPAPAPGEPALPEDPNGGLPPHKLVRRDEAIGQLHGLDVMRKRWEWKQRRRRGANGSSLTPL
ncbi:hypothetical protein LTR85_010106 [Meristemomyces frigidus]|nr:hypothetical protein LTR85_010106 [Meristemomyces frigidus]